LTTASVSRIATCGWLITGVAMIDPAPPGLVIVNEPPRTSSGVRAFARARFARSLIRVASPSTDSSCASRMTGTMRPPSPSDTAIPRCTPSYVVSVSSSSVALSAGNSRSASMVARAMYGR
jgi:hypothetical protein